MKQTDSGDRGRPKVASANKERMTLTHEKGLKDTEQRVEVLVAENS
jgi:hypothetical protein